MRVQICEPRPIPAGWTYTRCDRYSKERFLNLYRDDNGNVASSCIEYVAANPKSVYTVDDIIAIRETAKQHEVGSMHDITGHNTTKRYAYDYDKWRK